MRNVVILGMHRSGTSMVARALAFSGVYAGEDSELLQAQEDNPHGFWEREDLLTLNDAILAENNASWHLPPVGDLVASTAHAAAIDEIIDSLPTERSWLLKDPRQILTWPLWQDQLENPVLLFVYREPLAVAASLKRRNGFSLAQGLLLWEHYNRLAVIALRNRDAVCLSYEAVVANPGSSLTGMLEELAHLGVDCKLVGDPQLFDPSLNHSGTTSDGEVCILLSEAQCWLADYCRALCSGVQLPTLPAAGLSLLPRPNDFSTMITALEISNKKLREITAQQVHIYRSLLEFELSLLARISRMAGWVYKLLTLRGGMYSRYDDVLMNVRQYFSEHEMAMLAKQLGKVALLGNIIKYVLKNPTSSVRSFSFARLQRAFSVLFESSSQELDVWVKSRFPGREGGGADFDVASLDAELDKQEIHFPAVDNPLLSIVIPVYNDYRVTMNCLQSLLRHTQDVPYEVIVADDCSTDLTASIGERVTNIRVVRGEENLRFLGNCNRAATYARGRYILFLNNDTMVCPDWLPPLLALVEGDECVGIVGPKLLFADGRLQEAGGIMWRDGSAWNFGRMDDPDKPEYNYVKEADYVSGACLLIRTSLWQQLGGFDACYAPAYYEDADIAFAARRAGYRVLYQPLSRVFHFEGVSNGTDLEAGVKQYQVRNQATFREKWADELDAFHFNNAEHVFQARDRSRQRRCVLFIDHYVPHYDQDAGSRSTFMWIQQMLDMGYRVLFLGANFFPHKPYTETLQQMGVEVLVGEYMARNQNRWLRNNAAYIDRIYLHRPHIAEQFLGSLQKMRPCPLIIFFGHDLHYLRIEREMVVTGNRSLEKIVKQWRKREFAVFDQVDKVYYPSATEVKEIRHQAPSLDLRAIPLYIFPDKRMPAYSIEETSDILFVGGFNHSPNIDGIVWFVEEILPLVRVTRPEICVHVVGSNPTETVNALQSEQLIVHGYLSDEELDTLYARVRQVVVPLRFGAGVKGKVLEAIQKNRPLVTTSVGAEGIPDAASVMHIVDTAEEFAARVQQIDQGDSHAIGLMAAYPKWLHNNFSQENAARIIEEDFGTPLRDQDACDCSLIPTESVPGAK